MSAERRKLADDAEGRIAAAGVRAWPVVIRVGRSAESFGVTSAHHRLGGSSVDFIAIGKRVTIDDVIVETPHGNEVVPGIATRLLDLVVDSVDLRKAC